MFHRFVPSLAVLVFAGAAGAADAGSDSRIAEVQFGGPRAVAAAYDRGYREGVRQGDFDARRALTFDFQRDPVFREGTRGYERRFGSRDAYRDDFRHGYTDGYRSSYVRVRPAAAPGPQRNSRSVFGPAARSGGYEEPAYARGYSDGFKQGTGDGRDRAGYDPVGHRDYRSGDQGYYSAYGSRDAYRNNYRAGYREGYEEGYRSGAGRR